MHPEVTIFKALCKIPVPGAAVLGFAFQPQHSFVASSLPGYQCQEGAFGTPGPR